MIKNFWNNVTFYCLNHDEPVEMTTREGDSTFYACPKYMLKDEKHPDGHEEYEPMCMNRISFTKIVTIMEKLMKEIEEDEAMGMIADYTGMVRKIDGVMIKILKYDYKDIRIGILNKKAMES